MKRLYIPLPDNDGRLAIVKNLMKQQHAELSEIDLENIINKTAGEISSWLHPIQPGMQGIMKGESKHGSVLFV